ncbi:MAG: D-alanyl-D-alanine carboxypeptidase [Lachnospiraceae bacterium]|nr:D-alanyl-D-alanine carboxypeptidase [Lachnospiraceae bacterium]
MCFKTRFGSIEKVYAKESLHINTTLPIQEEASETIVEELDATQLYAKSAVLMDAQTGRVLYEKNGYEVLPMASTTKIMTCIVALENGNLEDVVTASSYAARMPKVKLGMRTEEQFYLKDLLYSLMLESHNDSAVAIAEHIGGSVEAFADMMNQKARDIGCYDTFFITPNGLDATATDEKGNTYTHSTTAADLARMMSYCIKESPEWERFLEITRTSAHSFANVACSRNFSCHNHNAFLTMMEGALSGKTGFTNNAGYCYVGALERDGKSFVVALLACGWPYNKSYKWSDTRKLMEYGLANYNFYEFADSQIDKNRLQAVVIADGQTEYLGEVAVTDVTLVGNTASDANIEGMLLRADEKPQIVYNLKEYLAAPVTAGTPVGTIQYVVGGKAWKTITVVTTNGAEKINYQWCFDRVLELFLMRSF